MVISIKLTLGCAATTTTLLIMWKLKTRVGQYHTYILIKFDIVFKVVCAFSPNFGNHHVDCRLTIYSLLLHDFMFIFTPIELSYNFLISIAQLWMVKYMCGKKLSLKMQSGYTMSHLKACLYMHGCFLAVLVEEKKTCRKLKSSFERHIALSNCFTPLHWTQFLIRDIFLQ